MTNENDSWLIVSGLLPEEFADIMEGLLLLLDVEGVQTINDEFLPPGETAPETGFVKLQFYLPNDSADDSLLTMVKQKWDKFLATHKLNKKKCGLQFKPLDSDDWQTSWRKFFHPTKLSNRFWFSPSWEKAIVKAGEIAIEIDPGMAFGTGTHESTNLLLQALDDYTAKGNMPENMLDVGMGTGVLSIAAAKLGISGIDAIDNDPDAIIVAKNNFERNNIDAQACKILDLDLQEVTKKYDLVLANIISSILLSLKNDLVQVLKSGSRLWLSGILVIEQQELIDAFTKLGLTYEESHISGEWICLKFIKA